MMNRKVIAYVWVVTAAAAAVFALLVTATQVVELRLFAGAALMTFIGFVSTKLSYRVQKGQTASVAFIPNLTAILLYPSWATALALAAGNALALAFGTTRGLKLLFNAAQYLLAYCISVFVYLGLGGESLQVVQSLVLA